MKKLLHIAIIFITFSANAQNTAVDFTQYDCDGQYHNLFQDLDSGKVVVMEFVMDCQLCIDAGIALQTLISQIDQQYPGVIRVYQFAYSSLLNCASMTFFKDTNNFHSDVFEENSHLMNHYGGFGMPTIGVAAGANHEDIFSQVGFIASDTAQLGSILRNYFSTISVNEQEGKKTITFSPNPVSDILFVNIDTEKEFSLEIIDIAGKNMLAGYYNGNESDYWIDVSILPAGLYFAKIRNSNIDFIDRIIIAH